MADEQEDTGFLDEVEEPAGETTEQDTDGNDETVDDDLAEGAEDDGDDAGEDSPASDDGDADNQDAEKPKGVKSRIDKLVREREDARRERDHYRRLAEEKARQDPPKEDKRPEQGDFENYDDYVEALADWKTRGTTRQIMAEEREQVRAAERQRQVDERFEAARKRIPDFDEVVDSGHAAEHVIDIIGDSDLVAELAYHLGKNPETARKLSAMSPTAAAREIGKIEARIQDRLKQQGLAPGKQKTGSPPITPAKNLGGGSGKITKNPEDLPPDEYYRWREEGGGE